mgnify:FL=1|tara:strand:+ start:63 stop:515 length:453 start_codon:yes stop_codon:yes gene_type:complete
MQVILLENIIKLGSIGDVVKVKDGYGRNFLLRKGKALRANKENIELVNKKKIELNKKETEIKNKFKEVSNKLKGKSIKFEKEAKENGELYGSIKPKEISTSIQNDLKIEIKPSQIEIKKDINQIGEFSILINLYSTISVSLKVIVKKVQS